MFRIYPAVDILGGRCVRLRKGNLSEKTVYSDKPWEMARHWQELGASFLHVVDLDGTVAGHPVNLGSLERILKEVDIPVQVGGGIRTLEDARRVLEMGAQRVILGTRALENRDFLRKAVESFGERIVVSLDTRGEALAVQGWTRDLDIGLEEAVMNLLECGVRRVVHTDIERDGTLSGHSGSLPQVLLDRGLKVIASGGIAGREDLLALRALSPRGVEGAVVGKALYDGALSLSDILDLEEA